MKRTRYIHSLIIMLTVIFLLRIVIDWNLKQEISDVETARIAYKKRQAAKKNLL